MDRSPPASRSPTSTLFFRASRPTPPAPPFAKGGKGWSARTGVPRLSRNTTVRAPMAQFLTTIRESPEPTFPAASVARIISRCTPGLRSGKRQRDLLARGVEEPVIGEEGRPGPAVEGEVRLGQTGQPVGEDDGRLLLARRDAHLRGLVVDHE